MAKKNNFIQDLSIIGRENPIFFEDIKNNHLYLENEIKNAKFLILGAAGSIGQAITREIFKRNPKLIHAVDISENNLVELVRDLRSTFNKSSTDLKTFALDIGSQEYKAFIDHYNNYDFVLNLSALKHVRSEKDPFTLMRMVTVNIFNTIETIDHAIQGTSNKYFCVSTDKAANPVNLMGASKRIMEMFLMLKSKHLKISTARFANVAFSDGSLLYGFMQRIMKKQPIAAPSDIRRYFITHQEAGELCMLSSILGENNEIFFPNLNEELKLISITDVAKNFIQSMGYEPILCCSEEEAIEKIEFLPQEGKWPCLFLPSDTTGEKEFEEFFTLREEIDTNKFKNIGIVKNNLHIDPKRAEIFITEISKLKNNYSWQKKDIVELFHLMIKDFNYIELNKYLDSKM